MSFRQNFSDMNTYYASSSMEDNFSPTDISQLVIDAPDYENLRQDIFEANFEANACMYQQNSFDFAFHQTQPLMTCPISPPFHGFSSDEISKCVETCTKFVLMRPENQERIKIEKKRERNRIAAAKCRRKKLEKIAYEEARIAQFNKELDILTLTRNRLEKELHQQKLEAWEHMKSGCHLPRTKKLLTSLQYTTKYENTTTPSYNLHEL